jgi:FAD/FMN-containing dehydrogenase
LAKRLHGAVLTDTDPGYDQARRVWNGCIDRRPAVIARCESTADVVAAVRVAGEEGLPVAVRGGGHSLPGFSMCNGGIVIDLSAMRTVHVDPDRRVAVVQGGARWADYDQATHTHGLASTGDMVSTTGVAGLTLGGASAG